MHVIDYVIQVDLLPLKSSRVSLIFSGGLSSISSARHVLGSLGNDWFPSYDSFLALCIINMDILT